MFLATIPAVIWVDKTGRKPLLVSGAFIMAVLVHSRVVCVYVIILMKLVTDATSS